MAGLKKSELKKTGFWKNGKGMRGAALLLAVTVMTAGLAGCGQEQEPGGQQASGTGSAPQGSLSKEAPEGQGQEAGKGYLFEVKGISLGVDMDMDGLKAGLGESKSVFEAPSCAAQGTAYVYDYGSFEIETYPSGEKNLIGYIILKDDTVATAEGVDLSKTRADIIKAYGDKYEESDNSLTYTRDGMKLKFIFSGEDIVSIEYASSVM